MDCIDELFSIDKDSGRSMRGMTVLVLGAGGVSRAIAWGLKQRHADVLIGSRTMERVNFSHLKLVVVPLSGNSDTTNALTYWSTVRQLECTLM